MNYTITKSKANINLLKQNLKEVSLAHGSTSRQADKLRNDILKESIAMQIAQGRADELSDELDEVARSQRKVRLATTLMGAGFAGARDSADRIATTLRSVGEVTQGVVGEIMATQFANLIPIMGSVVSRRYWWHAHLINWRCYRSRWRVWYRHGCNQRICRSSNICT